MKNANRTTKYILAFMLGAFAIAILIVSCKAEAKSDEILQSTETKQTSTELETVSLSYEEYLEQKTQNDTEDIDDNSSSNNSLDNPVETDTKEPVIDYSTMDVWTLGRELYGIPEYDTTRSLVLITFEGYGAESPLSYYVACACWTRATNGYLGYSDLYTSFGGADTWNYGDWLDNNGYADYAVDALRECYLNPQYIMNCNGMMVPESWIYEENGIYVW